MPPKKGYKQTAEHKANTSAARLGYKQSPEHKAKISAANMGNQNAVGYKHSDETRAKIVAANIGNKNSPGRKPVPVGSTHIKAGYVMIKVAEPSDWQLEHRYIMAASIGRALLPTEVVHHRNEVKDDNRPENLQLFENQSEHRHHHHKAA
jgi:hypothetical protein